ncbi:hypothetical protein C8Q75DRAFT_772712 [Abortiporus biennis]|nr:hypothetical protein C8Q75DRAFT_772712 [Abortiporus biennis]
MSICYFNEVCLISGVCIVRVQYLHKSGTSGTCIDSDTEIVAFFFSFFLAKVGVLYKYMRRRSRCVFTLQLAGRVVLAMVQVFDSCMIQTSKGQRLRSNLD